MQARGGKVIDREKVLYIPQSITARSADAARATAYHLNNIF